MENDLVGTIITISVVLVGIIGLIVFLVYGPRIEHPVPLAPVPAPKRKNPYEQTDKGKT